MRTFLQDHDVYVTDWVNAREVAVTDGRFDFFDYADHVRAILQTIGPTCTSVSVCQPGPPVLAAISQMAEEDDPARPASMTYMGSPIDARLAPTLPNRLAEEPPLRLVPVQHDLHRAAAPSRRLPPRSIPAWSSSTASSA